MERSWWFVLILICNMSYGQVSNGAIANNRFLQRTNPQIDRAIADGGSSLDHPEIQKLARQMVDLGIWSNLVLWVHEGLVKERVSGSNVFVPKAYDISNLFIDIAQTDTTKQLKLNNGFVFDGIDDGFAIQTVTSKLRPTSITVSYYCNLSDNLTFGGIFEIRSDIQRIFTFQRTNRIRAQIFVNGLSKQYQTPSSVINNWIMFTFTYTNNDLKLYVNGSLITPQILADNTIGNLSIPSNAKFSVGIDVDSGLPHKTLGTISDLRVYNSVLTASQIDAIFQETRGKYGI